MRCRYLILAIIFAVSACLINSQISELNGMIDSRIYMKFSPAPPPPPEPGDDTEDTDMSLFKVFFDKVTKNLQPDQKSTIFQHAILSKNRMAIIDIIQDYKKGTITETEWQQFIKSGDVPSKIIEERRQELKKSSLAQWENKINKREKILLELNVLESQKRNYQYGYYTVSVIAGLCFLLFLKNNPKHFATMITKNTTLASNTALILVSSWTYAAEHAGLLFSLAIAACAILNAYLFIKGFESRELSVWLSYTANIFVLIAGLWLMNKAPWYQRPEFQIGTLISIIGILNLYYRFKITHSLNKYGLIPKNKEAQNGNGNR